MKTLINFFKRVWQFIKSLFVKRTVPAVAKPEGRSGPSRPYTQPQYVSSYKRMAWTNEEEEYLTNNYSNTKDSVLAMCLNRSKYSISKKARKLGLKKSLEFFYACSTGEATIETKLARIMEMQKDVGEFSVDLYYNRLAPKEERCVARYHEVLSRKVYHARCKNFSEALDRMHEYVSTLI